MNKVLDASAILAFLAGEPGADVVESALVQGSCCGAANYSEVAQKIVASGMEWSLVAALLDSFELKVEPVLPQDGIWAAMRWRHGEGLSLADRLCMALGDRLGVEILTADRSWGDSGRFVQIR